MRAILLDDEQYVLDNLVFLLRQFEGMEILLATTMWQEAMEAIQEKQPDVVFADIEMPGMTGLELGDWLAVKTPGVKIVFITAYEQYALDAFGVSAVDYVLKPVTMQKLSRTMQKLSHCGLNSGSEVEKKEIFRIIGNRNSRFELISPEEGQYIEVNQRELKLVTRKQIYLLNHSMGYWEKHLVPYHWFRCHKSYLVNLDQIESVYPMFNSVYQVKMKGRDTEIPVSRTFLKEFKQKFGL